MYGILTNLWQVNLLKVLPFQVNLSKMLPSQVNLLKVLPSQVNLSKVLPSQVNHNIGLEVINSTLLLLNMNKLKVLS